MNDDILLSKIVKKKQPVLIKFRSMTEILTKFGAWFDGHGNLCVAKHRSAADGHLSPIYFHYLGKTVEMVSHHSFPDWCIEEEWQPMFAPNMALRSIASGKLSPERMIELAKESVYNKVDEE